MTDSFICNFLKRAIWSLLILGIFCVFPGRLLAAQYTIAILPFKINGPEKYRYLQEGIADMLSSRLYETDAIDIADSRQVEELARPIDRIDSESARKIGERIRSDYVLFGTVTILGQSLSLDARGIPTSDSAEPFLFSRESSEIDSLITHIDALARDFKSELLGKRTAAQSTQSAQAPSTGPSSQKEEDFFELEPQSPFIQMLEKQQAGRQFWQSQSYKLLINGLDLGDVDQDGQLEVVFASREKVHIYRAEDDILSAVQVLPTSPGMNNLSLDVADINQNGYPEIFVSCLGQTNVLIKSFVLEYDGQKYQKIVQDSPWFYRVAKPSHTRPVLLGQRQEGKMKYTGEIHQLKATDQGYVPDFQLLPDEEVNLLGVGYGYVTKTADKNIVAYDQRNRLQVFGNSGNSIWKSDEKYGGSSLFMTQEKPEPGEPRERFYFPLRVRIVDIDENGQNEVVTIKNQDLLGEHLKRFRHYRKGQIVSFSWDGIGLAEDWKTRQLSGQVRDFCFGDLNNDGTRELVAVLIKDEGRVITQDPKSLIISYPLEEGK